MKRNKDSRRYMMPMTLLALSVSLGIQNLHAAEKVDLRMQQDFQTKSGKIINVKALLDANETDMSQTYMEMMRETQNERGVTFRRYQQMYQNVPVWGEMILEREDGDENSEWSGTMVVNIGDDVTDMTPSMDEDTAMSIVKDAHNNMLLTESEILEYRDEEKEMVIYVDDNDKANLAYSVSYFSDSMEGSKPERIFAIVDAHSGDILSQWDGLATAVNATGPGGNEKTGRYIYGQDYDPLVLDDNCRFNNSAVRTINLNHGTTGTTPFQINCNSPNNDFKTINGAYSPINDAHFFGKVIFDLYQETLGMAPLQNQLVMRVHYSNNYENAFWDGRAMTFGDGGSFMYPLVSLDVAAHEVSHGFTEQNSNLVYRNQSGGINESFSDMAGEAAELFFKGSVDFLTGADIIKGNNQFLRSLENPPLDGRSIAKASDYRTGMDVHYSSGVYNRAYTLLAKKPGWDAIKAFKLFAIANKNYWTQSSTFNQAACGALDAANDLGYAAGDVFDALAAVEVACPNRPRPGDETPNPDPVMDGTLQNGVAQSNLSGSREQQQFFSLELPENAKNLRIQISGGNGDADLYVRYGQKPSLTQYDFRPYRDGNNELVSISAPQAGTFHVMLNGYTGFGGLNLVASFEVEENQPQVFTNSGDYRIPDANRSGVMSPLDVTRRGQVSLVTLNVDIRHTYRGDLVLRLITPNNRVFTIEDLSNFDSRDNLIKSYTLDFSSINLDSEGQWRLQALDLAFRDVGYINEWSLNFDTGSISSGNADTPAPSEGEPSLHDNEKDGSEDGSVEIGDNDGLSDREYSFGGSFSSLLLLTLLFGRRKISLR